MTKLTHQSYHIRQRIDSPILIIPYPLLIRITCSDFAMNTATHSTTISLKLLANLFFILDI